MKNIFLLLPLSMFLGACTYNVSMAHTEGTAEDVVDTTQRADAKVDPQVTIPASVLP